MAQVASHDMRPDEASPQLKAIAMRLDQEAGKRVAERQPMERRWIEDLEQYHGRYDSETQANLKKLNSSQLFINLTRPKTDAMTARLMDLLFPTDDRNWGVNPTPVPELTEVASQAAKVAQEFKTRLAQEQKAAEEQGGQVPPEMEQQANAAEEASKALQGQVEEGKRRAELMATEIDDQLKASLYPATMRDLIEDACRMGTGVCKGPVTGDRVRKGWKQQLEQNEAGQMVDAGYGLEMAEGDHPAMRWVDLWSFFPDMNAATVEESEGIFERHLMNKKKLRELGRMKGFDQDAIRRLHKLDPTHAAPWHVAELRSIRADNQQVTSSFYHVWEYSGPLSAEDLKSLAESRDDNANKELAAEMEDVDPLEEVNARVWFCQDEVLKFSIYPYESGECMYSVFCLSKDEHSIFGEGIPAIMRDPQRALNAGWRAMMDNAAIGSGSQIVIDKSKVRPENGSYKLEPRKVWEIVNGLTDNKYPPFWTFDIPVHQEQNANIIAIAQKLIDDMTAMPQIAQGEQGNEVTQTAHGMTLLMNSANVVFRRIVKNFDDDVTTPNIRRFYDWNMQFNTKDEIKGDYEVDARGSSVLLVREMQAQNLMFVATQLGGHPKFGVMFKDRELLKKLFQAMMVPADELLLDQDTIDAILMQAQASAETEQSEAEASIEMAKVQLEQAKIELAYARIDADVAIANMEASARMQQVGLQHEGKMIAAVESRNTKLDELDVKSDIEHAKIRHDEDKFVTDAMMANIHGPSGGNF